MNHAPRPMARIALLLALAFGSWIQAGATPRPAGPMVKLDDTGSTRCIAQGAFTNACAGTGQDGESGRDANARHGSNGRAGFRFTRICTSGEAAGAGTCPAKPKFGTGHDQWGCTRDEVTGLTWEIKLADGSIRDAHRLVSMQNWGYHFTTVDEVRGALNAATLCGSTDWDTPTFSELVSLLDYGTRAYRKVDRRFFPNTPLDYAWGTPYPTRAINDGSVEALDFATGRDQFFVPGDGRYVRLVVRPEALREVGKRFVPSADGTEITDRWAHLVWQRCRLGTAWNGHACAGHATDFRWTDALAAARAAGPPWRLANVKEVLSLSDLELGAIDQVAFPGTLDVVLWTSTPWNRDPKHAWRVWYYEGAEFYIDKSSIRQTGSAFLVRNH